MDRKEKGRKEGRKEADRVQKTRTPHVNVGKTGVNLQSDVYIDKDALKLFHILLARMPPVQLYSWVAIDNWSGYYRRAAVTVPSCER